MEILKEESFRKQIKNGLAGGYLLYGDEDYLKAFSVDSARKAICPDPTFSFFNDMRIDVTDYTPSALLDALMPLPMMEEKKIVTLTGLRPSEMKTGELDDLCEALEALAEYDYNVLLMVVPAGGLDEGTLPRRPSSVLTRLSEFLIPVRYEAVSPARLVSWVGKHFVHNGVTVSEALCSYLVQYCGNSMYLLASEIDKLSYYVLSHGRNTVTEEDVRYVATPQMNTDAFALANAVLDGKHEQALEALSVMKYRRVEPIIVLSEVLRVVGDLLLIKALLEDGKTPSEISATLKMNEYKVKIYASSASGKSLRRIKRTLELCREADRSLKLSPQGYLPIETLICAL